MGIAQSYVGAADHPASISIQMKSEADDFDLPVAIDTDSRLINNKALLFLSRRKLWMSLKRYPKMKA
jgi:hypothetical protein